MSNAFGLKSDACSFLSEFNSLIQLYIQSFGLGFFVVVFLELKLLTSRDFLVTSTCELYSNGS